MASNAPRPTKSERLEAARIEARAKREAAEKKRRQRSLWTKIGIIVGIVALVAGGGLWYYFGSVKPNNTVAQVGPIPANANQYGGVVVTGENKLAPTPEGSPTEVDIASVDGAASVSGAKTEPQGADANANPAQIIVYVDPLCPYCKQFEDSYGADLDAYVKEGKATVEYRMVTFLDRISPSNYSSRASNALACVAAEDPAGYVPFLKSLYAAQDEGLVDENSKPGGLSNAELAERAQQAGVSVSIKSCVDNGTYRPWVKVATGLALKANVQGTPAVIVNGATWDGTTDADFKVWADAKIAAADK
ncbi:MAG: thioredoxin domain-containing protein [Arthrobacter sp.]|jgi:protein-disulfide isomerase|nr:thioredoxin domain-containing protein [Arthrobacter sp.]